jgi:hypothetical protein
MLRRGYRVRHATDDERFRRCMLLVILSELERSERESKNPFIATISGARDSSTPPGRARRASPRMTASQTTNI